MLRDRLLVFFVMNPDEALMIPDIEAKFGVHRSTAQQVATHMTASGLLSKAKGKRAAPMVLSAGPTLLAMLGAQA